MRPAAFAVPGDIDTPTGGYIYERRLLEVLRAQGRDVIHLRLPASFPDPAPRDVDETVNALLALSADRPVILDGFVSGALPTRAIACLRAPFVAMVHHPLALEEGLPAARARWLEENERNNLALAAHVLVPSPHTKSILVARYGVAPGRITVARPGVDRPAGDPAPADPPLVLSVGIVHPRKGHDVLVAALGHLRHLGWQAVIVGSKWDAGHAAALARQVSDADLDGRVRIAGHVSTPELHRLYRAAHVFALATRYEGYGLVFDEALAAGLPVVSCRTGAVPDTVPAAASRLVPPDDPRAFAHALGAMLADPDLHAEAARAARAHGAMLGDWPGTGKIAGAVLDALAP